MKFFDKWDQKLTRLDEGRFYFVFLSVMAIVVTVIVTGFALYLHHNFLTIACDTAGIHTAVVNTMHGNWFRNTAYGGPNILGAHTTFILLLLVPFYAMFPTVDALFTLQVVGIYSTVIPIYLVAREILGRPLLGFLIALMALTSPMLFQMAMAPVHPESWIIAAVFWSYFFYGKNRPVAFWVSYAFAVCSGEPAALIYIALGIALFLTEDGLPWRKRYATFALLGGFGWLAFALYVVTPLMHNPGQDNVFAYNYVQWKITSPLQLLGAMVMHPFQALGYLLNPIRWSHLVGLVGLPLVLAFASWRSLILLAPLSAYLLMSNQEFYLYFHAYYYQSAFFAGYMGFIFFLARWNAINRLGIAVMSGAAILNVAILCGAVVMFGWLAAGADEAYSATLRDAFKTIPPDAGVYSPHRFSAYLSNRENMVLADIGEGDFDTQINSRFNTTNVRADQIDYLVVDMETDQCGWRRVGTNPEAIKRRATYVQQLINSGQWQLFWHQDEVFILRRVEKPG